MYSYYVSILPDRYHFIAISISDKPSASIGTYFFRGDFRNREGLERSDSENLYEAYRIVTDPFRKPNENTSGMIIAYDFEFKWKQKTYIY